MPAVSIVMSTYSRNRPEGSCPNLLRRSLDSIVNQAFKDFELILIDDGSTDGTEIVCREYAEKYNFIKYIRFEENSGFPAKRYNDGIEASSGEYIMFMFDDDKLYPNAVKELYEAISGKYSSFAMVYGLVNYMNAATGGALAYNFGAEWDVERIKTQNFLCNNSVIIKRSVLEDVGGYDESATLRRLCDWELWRRIGLKYPVKRVPVLVGEVYAYHKDSIGVMHQYSMKDIYEHIDNPARVIRYFKSSKKKIKRRIVFVHHGHDASLRRWRIDYFAEALRGKGHDVNVVHVVSPNYISECMAADIIIFYRCYYPQSDFIRKLVSLKKLVIYDIDDYVFQKDGKYNSSNDIVLINAYFSVVNCVMASTQKLLEQIPADGKKKIVRENFINRETFDLLKTEKTDKSVSSAFRVGWLTGINRVEMQDFVFALLTKLDATGEDLEFYYFGRNDSFSAKLSSLKKIKIIRLDYVPTDRWRELYQIFKNCRFDVVINPLDEGDVFMHSKSAIKMAECSPMGVPLITSRTWPFLQHVKEGVNGYFASSIDEFAEKILHLKKHPEELSKVSDTVRDYAVNFLSDKYIDSILCEMEDALTGILDKPKVARKHEISLAMPSDVFDVKDIVKYQFTSPRQGLNRIAIMAHSDTSDRMPVHILLTRLQDDVVIVDKVFYFKSEGFQSALDVSFPTVIDSEKKDFQIKITLLGNYSLRLYCSSRDIDKELCMKLFFDDVKKIEQKNVLIKIKSSLENVLSVIPIARNLVEERGVNVMLETNCNQLQSKYIQSVYPIGCSISGEYEQYNLTDMLEMSPASHVTDLYGVKILGHHFFDKTIDVDISAQDVNYVESIFSEKGMVKKGYVVFHESSGPANKTWPIDRWTRLEAHCLAAGMHVVAVGFGGDNIPRMPAVVNLVNKLTIPQIKYVLDNAKCVVTTDSFVLQLCSGNNTKVVAIFLSTLPAYRVPYHDKKMRSNVVSIVPQVECSGCWHFNVSSLNYAGCKNRDFRCVTSITPKMVFDAIVNT